MVDANAKPPTCRVKLSPAQFRTRAHLCGWQPKTIELILKKPYPKDHFAIGDDSTPRVLALVSDE